MDNIDMALDKIDERQREVAHENSMIAEWLEKHPKVRDKSKFIDVAVNGQTGHQRGSNG